MVAVDVTVAGLFVVIVRSKPLNIMLLAFVCLATLFIFNVLFLRRAHRKIGPPAAEDSPKLRSRSFFVYVCAAIYFLGTLYGVLMISEGELPRTMWPLLLIPLSLAIFCLKTARRIGPQKRGF